MRRILLTLTLCFLALTTHAQQTDATPAPTPAPPTDAPLPSIRDLLLDVERNQKAAELLKEDYTYHLHREQQDYDRKGGIKKTVTTEEESLSIQGVRVDRVTSRDGKPLTPDELKKEDDRIDSEVAKAKSRRARIESKGGETDSRGDQILTASRILELGIFTNPRRVTLNGRPTIVVDYAGDPHAKTHTEFEAVFRDLVGTIWIDEQDRILVQTQAHFLKDFKIAAGLVADVHKDSTVSAHWTKFNNQVWLLDTIDAHGKVSFLLVTLFNGSLHLAASDYRRFHTSATIVGTNGAIDANGNPIPNQNPDPTPTPTPAPAPKP